MAVLTKVTCQVKIRSNGKSSVFPFWPSRRVNEQQRAKFSKSALYISAGHCMKMKVITRQVKVKMRSRNATIRNSHILFNSHMLIFPQNTSNLCVRRDVEFHASICNCSEAIQKKIVKVWDQNWLFIFGFSLC